MTKMYNWCGPNIFDTYMPPHPTNVCMANLCFFLFFQDTDPTTEKTPEYDEAIQQTLNSICKFSHR